MSTQLTSPRLRLLPVTESDILFLVAVRNETRDAFFDTRVVDEDSTRRWLARSTAAGELNWVIEAQGTRIGTLSAIPRETSTEVGRLAVLPDYRRRGYMEEALRLVLPYLAANSPTPIYLEVKPDNEPAVRLYEKLKFRVTRLRMDFDDTFVSTVGIGR